MVQIIGNEIITCPACNEEHESQLIAFPKKLEYRGQILNLTDFYHSCPNQRVLVPTGRDIIETFKLERKVKSQVDAAIAQQMQWQGNIQQ